MVFSITTAKANFLAAGTPAEIQYSSIFMAKSNPHSPFLSGILFLLIVIFYLNFTARIILSPLLPVVEKDLGLGHGDAGSLFFYIALGYGLGLLFSGFIAARLIHRYTITLSSVMIGISLIFVSLSTSLTGIHFSLLLLGGFAGFYLPSGIATLTEMIPREHWGKAMAVHELGPNLGFITAPLLCEALLRFFSWREALGAFGVFTVLMAGVFWGYGRGGTEKGKQPSFPLMKEVFTNPSFLVMTVLFMVSIGSSLGLYTIMPLYLVSEMGLDRGFANTIIGFSRAFGIVAMYFAGLLSDRVGHKHTVTLFIITTGFLTLCLGFIRGPIATPVFLFLQGASAACLFPIGFTLIAFLFPDSLRSVAVSLVIFGGFILGGGFVPSFVGHWAEVYSFSSAFTLIGLLFLALLPLFLRLKIQSS
jgi:NNP family nitrate/nitrite transporter-like MFS transporter